MTLSQHFLSSLFISRRSSVCEGFTVVFTFTLLEADGPEDTIGPECTDDPDRVKFSGCVKRFSATLRQKCDFKNYKMNNILFNVEQFAIKLKKTFGD
jgi:hypothetical protein